MAEEFTVLFAFKFQPGFLYLFSNLKSLTGFFYRETRNVRNGMRTLHEN